MIFSDLQCVIKMIKLAVIVTVLLAQQNVASKNINLRNLSPDHVIQDCKQTNLVIQTMALNTQYDIQSWIKNIKIKAENLINKLKERLKEIRDNTKAMIKEYFGKEGKVTLCVKKDHERIEEIVTNIVSSASKCMSENMAIISRLEDLKQTCEFSDYNLVDDLDKKLNQCAIIDDKVDECISNHVSEINKQAASMERKIQETNSEARNIVNDLLDKMMSCTIEGLVQASSNITVESIRIIKCVISANN